jgi:L-fuculose-phosphate aldolase
MIDWPPSTVRPASARAAEDEIIEVHHVSGASSQSVSPPAAIAEAMGHIYRRGMTTTSGGNISVRDDSGAIWITPSQIDKGRLTAQDIACVKPGGHLEGRHKPSSEFPAHRQIYEARQDLRAIVHAHSTALVAFSICHEVPDTAVLPEIRDLCGEVGYAPYEKSGSEALGRRIMFVFADGHDCVMLENHGAVVAAPGLDLALRRFEALELTAQMLIQARMIGDVGAERPGQESRLANAGPGPDQIERRPLDDREAATGREFCEFARRCYRQRLTISGGGAFSARLNERAFIITRGGADWRRLGTDDLVRVDDRIGTSPPSSDRVALVHEAIYRRHPRIGAIVTVAPPHATAFAVTGQPLDSRIMFESCLFLRDIVRVSGDVRAQDPAHIAALVGPNRPASLIEREGALVVGASIFEAFDRLEVLDATAAAALAGRGVGRIIPLTDRMIGPLPGDTPGRRQAPP